MPKSFNDFIANPEDGEKVPSYVLEGEMEVMPDCRYASGQVYTLRGLGPIFSGPYRVRRAVHVIDVTGYQVHLTMTKAVGKPVSSSSSNAGKSSETRRPKAETQNPKKEEGRIVVDKESGRWWEQ